MEKKVKYSFTTTILNEEATIDSFLDSILKQTVMPSEIIIVDGGSRDKTLEKIKMFELAVKEKIRFEILVKKGNRSIGRNEAVRHSRGDVILISDAGCILDKDWVKNIIKPFEDKNVDVVAGYYKGEFKNIFQKCLIPYILVMPDRVEDKSFLPASRTMAMRKKVWDRLGGFDVSYSNNEDYVFAKKLKKNNVNIEFKKDAIARWIPPNTLKSIFITFFRFALGDAEARILRPKVALIFIRYFIGLLLFIIFIFTDSIILLFTISFLLVTYLLWAISKNYKYVEDVRAFLYLPLLQIVSDIAVLSGTVFGLVKRNK